MTYVELMEAVASVERSTVKRWGHGFDRIDRASVALVIADEMLSAVAGISEDLENNAYRVQCAAFNEWWSVTSKAVDPFEPSGIHVRDVSYGWAKSEVAAARSCVR
jgi:hypothetical protein